MIPIPKGLFITPGRQSQPFRQARSSLGQYQMPARARAGRTEDAATEALMMTASYAAQEYNMDAAHERSIVQSEAESAYRTTFSELSEKFPDNPERWRPESMAAAENILSNKTDKGNPLMDFLFNDRRSKEKMTADMKLFDAKFEGVVQQGIGKKRLRQIKVRAMKLTQSVNETVALDMQAISEGSSGSGRFERLRWDTEKSIDLLVKDLADPSKTPYLDQETRIKEIDRIVEDWGSSMIGAMIAYAPEQAKQHLQNIKYMFSSEFADGKYTKYWDKKYQSDHITNLREMVTAAAKTSSVLEQGNALKYKNQVDSLTAEVSEVLGEGDPSLEVRTTLLKKVTDLRDDIAKIRSKFPVADDDGVVHYKSLVDPEVLRQWFERVHDSLWMPINRKLIDEMTLASEDNNSKSAQKLLREMKTTPGGTWRVWRNLISEKARNRFLDATSRLTEAERGRSRAAETKAETARRADHPAIINTALLDAEQKLLNYVISGERVEVGVGPVDTRPLLPGEFEAKFYEVLGDMRSNLSLSNISPTKSNLAIQQLKRKLADNSPIIAAFIKATTPEQAPQAAETIKTLLPFIGPPGLARLLQQDSVQKSTAAAEVEENIRMAANQYVMARKNGLKVTPESVQRLMFRSSRLFANMSGADVEQASAGANLIIAAVDASNSMHSIKQEYRRLWDQGNYTQAPGDYEKTLAGIDASLASLKNIIEQKGAPLGMGIRKFVFGKGKDGRMVIDTLMEHLELDRKMLTGFYALFTEGVRLQDSDITYDMLKAWIGFDEVPTSQVTSTSPPGYTGVPGDTLRVGPGVPETGFQQPLTRGQRIFAGIGSGKEKDVQAAITLIKTAPEFVNDYKSIFLRGVSRQVLNQERGYEHILRLAEAANILGANDAYTNRTDSEALSDISGAFAASQSMYNREDQSYQKAKFIIDYLDDLREARKAPYSGSLLQSFESGEDKQDFLSDVAARFTGRHSAYKSWFKLETLHMSPRLLEAIKWNMALIPANFADDIAPSKRRDLQVSEVVKMLELEHVTPDILGHPASGSWSPTNANLILGGWGPHLRNTWLGKTIAMRSGSPGGLEEGQMYSEIGMAATVLHTVREAIRAHEAGDVEADPSKALESISFKDVAYAFKGNHGLGRDNLLRKADEMVWAWKGIPKDKWPEVNYNIGHPMSAFGFAGLERRPDFADSLSRNDYRALAPRREDSTESNLQTYTNFAQGRMVPHPKNKRSQVTIILSSSARYELLRDTLKEYAGDVGIPEAAKNIEMLGKPTTNVLQNIQIDLDGTDFPIFHTWLREWEDGTKRKSTDNANTVSRYSGSMLGGRDMVRPHHRTGAISERKITEDYVVDDRGVIWSLVTGDRLDKKPEITGAESKRILSAGPLF